MQSLLVCCFHYIGGVVRFVMEHKYHTEKAWTAVGISLNYQNKCCIITWTLNKGENSLLLVSCELMHHQTPCPTIIIRLHFIMTWCCIVYIRFKHDSKTSNTWRNVIRYHTFRFSMFKAAHSKAILGVYCTLQFYINDWIYI